MTIDSPSWDELEKQLETPAPVDWDPDTLEPGARLLGLYAGLEEVERSGHTETWTEYWLVLAERDTGVPTRVKIAGNRAKGWLEANLGAWKLGTAFAVRFDGMTVKPGRLSGQPERSWPEYTVLPDRRKWAPPPLDPQEDDRAYQPAPDEPPF